MICGSIFGDSWGALEDHGRDRESSRWLADATTEAYGGPAGDQKDGLGNQGRILEEKTHIFKPFGKTQMWLKHSK